MEYGWIASREEDVEDVLTSDDFYVRPPQQQVPAAMRGTRLGDIFERLVRMNDGERHHELRRRVESNLAQWSADEIQRRAKEAAARVAPGDVASYTIAGLIGIRDPDAVLPWIRDFAGAIAGDASEDAVARGIAAAEPLIAALPENEDADEVANILGFLFQAHAATAALIENMQSGRTGPPVLLTRRYAVRDTHVGGTAIRAGETVIVLLVSSRFYFGAGRHACPGKSIAHLIAQAAVSA